MADKRAEARRRRILENHSERLEKLQNLSRLEHVNSDDKHAQTSSIDDKVTHQHDGENATQPKYHGDHLDLDSNFSPKTNNEAEHLCKDYNATATDNNIDDRNEIKDTGCSNVDGSDDINLNEGTLREDIQPSWFMRKYRLILFVLLAWGVYMVVAKEFDFVFAYILGHKLPKDVLPYIILTAFVGVEVQVLCFGALILQKSPEEQSQSMSVFVLQVCGVPKNLLNFLSSLSSICSCVLTDLCVYIFVIVILKTLDEMLY